MPASDVLREHVARLLGWEDAHVGFDRAVANLPEPLRSRQPSGLPYSAWQLVEHIRITQHDILEFCINPGYQELSWPDEYWPRAAVRGTEWDESIEQFRRDRLALERLSLNRQIDLESTIPHGNGQTYLREVLLAADHTAYHVGELIVVRRLLGAWAG